MTKSIDQINIVQKAKSAIITLSARTLLLNIIQIFSRFFLARNLLAADFGSFGILQGWIGTLMFFTDIGLGDVLSRKSKGFSRSDFSCYFFIRLCLAVLVSLIFILIYPQLQLHYLLQFEFAKYAGIISIFIILDVLSACPMMIMGHKMEFGKIAKIELSSLFITYIVQIYFSFIIKGPWSFFIGLFFGKLSSVFMAFYFVDSFSFPKFNFEVFKSNFLKGILFQVSTILPSLQVIINPFILSYFLKVESIGLIFWIEGLVSIPLSLIFNYNRVAFISLSKFVDDPDRLKDVISSFLMPMFLGICFVFGLGAVLSKDIIMMIFGLKWLESTFYIHLSCLSIGLFSLRFLGLSILSATNNPKVRLYNEMLMIVLTSILLAFFISTKGLNGYFIGSIFANVVCLLVMIYSIRKYIHSFVYRRLFSVLFAMLFSVLIIFKFRIHECKIGIVGICFTIIYFGITIILDSTVLNDVKKISKQISLKFARI